MRTTEKPWGSRFRRTYGTRIFFLAHPPLKWRATIRGPSGTPYDLRQIAKYEFQRVAGQWPLTATVEVRARSFPASRPLRMTPE